MVSFSWRAWLYKFGLLHEHAAGKKEGYSRTPDYPTRRSSRACVFTSYSYHSNLQDEIAGQDGVRKWMFCKFEEDLQEIINYEDSKQKYLWGIVKQIQHGLFREVVKIPGPLVLDARDYFPPLRVGK